MLLREGTYTERPFRGFAEVSVQQVRGNLKLTITQCSWSLGDVTSQEQVRKGATPTTLASSPMIWLSTVAKYRETFAITFISHANGSKIWKTEMDGVDVRIK